MASVELREIDFFVIKEDYSRIMLEDGTTLKVKIVLKKILMSPLLTPEGYPSEVLFDSMNVAVAMVPQSLKRSPSAEPFNPMVDKGEEVKILAQKISLQEYMTDNGFRITIEPVVRKIFRYNKYDPLGEPLYNANVQQIANVDKTEMTSK